MFKLRLNLCKFALEADFVPISVQLAFDLIFCVWLGSSRGFAQMLHESLAGVEDFHLARWYLDQLEELSDHTIVHNVNIYLLRDGQSRKRHFDHGETHE